MYKSLFIRTVMTTAILSALLSPFVVADKPKNKSFPAPAGASADAKRSLAAALEASKSGDLSATDLVRQFNTAIEQALEKLAPQSVAAERLTRALESRIENNDDQLDVDALQKAIADVFVMLSFEPLLEAELPKGVPTYTPVGTIEVKKYPTYRKATGGSFFTLFRHIQSNNIAMTAPVQMQFDQEESGNLSQQSMAFLYGSMDLGETGKQGSVVVSDAEPVTVVSAGVSGLRRQSVLADSVARLERWIAQNPDYERAGTVRVMGYNSPFVPAAKQYFEVQIPIWKGGTNDASE